jgi:hypothetical protein
VVTLCLLHISRRAKASLKRAVIEGPVRFTWCVRLAGRDPYATPKQVCDAMCGTFDVASHMAHALGLAATYLR